VATHRQPSWNSLAWLITLAVAALALRVALGHDVGYPTDMVHYIEWADAGAQHPLGEMYSRTSPNYPPGYVSVLWLLGKMRIAFPALTRPDLRYLFMKVPAIVADIVTGGLIYLIVGRNLASSTALWAAALYLFNPAVISDSTSWGQTDGLVPVFPLLALAALDRRRWWLVGPLLAAAIATKFQAIVFDVALLAFVLVDFGIVRTLATAVLGCASFLLISVPFLLTRGQFARMIDSAYTGTLNFVPSVRLGALNLWDVLDPAVADDDWTVLTVHGIAITPKTLGLALFVLASVPVILAGCTRRNAIARAYVVGMVGWLFFMFPTQIHERYLLPAVAFFTISAVQGAAATAVLAVVTAIHLYSCFFQYSWGGGLSSLMRILLVPAFLGAMYHLRTQATPVDDRPPETWMVAWSRWLTQRMWWSMAAICLASLCVALAVGGWFHTGERSLAEIIHPRPSNPVRFKFPPAFSRLRAGIEVAGSQPSCSATFSVRSTGAPIYDSGPVLAGTGVQPIDVAIAKGETDLSFLVQATGCSYDTTFSWVAPRLEPWRAAKDWGDGGVIFLSDLPGPGRGALSWLGGKETWRRDRSSAGSLLTIAGRRFTKGLGVVTDSVLGFSVPEGAVAFLSNVGFDDTGQRGAGKIRFTVLVDGKETYRSPDMAPNEAPADVRVPVSGARRITLVVESPAVTGPEHADWGDARFIRAEGS